ncbi:MAG: NAD/NADP octopine/nopaline dehydrogenase family protein [Actinomycetota bacterium]
MRPERAVVVGSGGGALTIAAELGLLGLEVVLTDQPRFAGGLIAIEAQRGIRVVFEDEGKETLAPVAHTSDDPEHAIVGAQLVIVSVPAFGHRPLADLLASTLDDGQTVLWVGEGGGSFATVAALRSRRRRPGLALADTNSLPYGGARVEEPGRVRARRKVGGTYLAALPTAKTADLVSQARHFWPWVEAAVNAWESLLLNFNAIDHVATVITNLGRLETTSDALNLWKEGASPGVARVIEAVDGEYVRLREALGLPVKLRYEDFLVAQGLVPSKGASLHATIQASLLATSRFSGGISTLKHRYITEDVPYSLVLASSLANELRVGVPVIDGLIALASAAASVDFRKEGRTLEGWGLAGAGRDGLLAAVDAGWW